MVTSHDDGQSIWPGQHFQRRGGPAPDAVIGPLSQGEGGRVYHFAPAHDEAGVTAKGKE